LGFNDFVSTIYISSYSIHFRGKSSSSSRTVGVYPIILLFSIAFSLPTFLIYLTCFYFLSKRHLDFSVAKLILIAVAVLGIIITQTIIKGSMSQDIIAAYSITAIIVGLILKLKEVKTKILDSSIAT